MLKLLAKQYFKQYGFCVNILKLKSWELTEMDIRCKAKDNQPIVHDPQEAM